MQYFINKEPCLPNPMNTHGQIEVRIRRRKTVALPSEKSRPMRRVDESVE